MHEGVVKQDESSRFMPVRAARRSAMEKAREVTGPLTPDMYKYAMDQQALLKARLNYQHQEAN